MNFLHLLFFWLMASNALVLQTLDYRKYATGYPDKSDAEMVEYVHLNLTPPLEDYIRQQYHAWNDIIARLHRREPRFIHFDFLEVKIAYSRMQDLDFGNMEAGAYGPYDCDLYAHLCRSFFGTFPPGLTK